MLLRPATTGDLGIVQGWDTNAHVVAASGADDGWDWPAELARDPDWREFLIAEVDGRPIGMIQIIDPAREEAHYWGDDVGPNLRAIDIWIGEESDLGLGFGSEMMRLTLRQCFSDPSVQAILVDPLAANKRAHRFYERFGFRRVERRTFGADDCFVFRLDRDTWQQNPHAAR